MERAYRMLVPLKADFGWGKNWLWGAVHKRGCVTNASP